MPGPLSHSRKRSGRAVRSRPDLQARQRRQLFYRLQGLNGSGAKDSANADPLPEPIRPEPLLPEPSSPGPHHPEPVEEHPAPALDTPPGVDLAPPSTRRLTTTEAHQIYEVLGKSLQSFNQASKRMSPLGERLEHPFKTQDWTRLIRNKLLPQLQGELLMIVAVAGATNTGKSTVFNQLVGEQRSPERVTAAATKQGLVAVRPDLVDKCLGSQGEGLFPEFQVRRLIRPEEVLESYDQDAIFVAESTHIPPNLVLFDTPDINSILKENWEIAEKIMFASDVILAVLHPVAYADKKVVDFCRKAKEMGRTVIPVVNMIDARDLHVVVNDFKEKSGLEFEYAFWLENDPGMRQGKHRQILSVTSGAPLHQTLSKLDFYQIKSRAVVSSLEVFLTSAEKTLRILEERTHPYRTIARELDRELDRAADAAVKKVPFGRMLELVEEFAQDKRPRILRGLMYPFNLAFRLAREMGKGTQSGFRWILHRLRSGQLDLPVQARFEDNEQDLIVEIGMDLFGRIEALTDAAREDVTQLFRRHLTYARHQELAERIRKACEDLPDYSDSFRKETFSRLDEWWHANPSRTSAFLLSDFLLAVLPTAVALPVAVFTGGIHAHEIPWISAAALTPFFNKLLEIMGVPLRRMAVEWRQERIEKIRKIYAEEITGALMAELGPIANLTVSSDYTDMTSSLDEIRECNRRMRVSEG
jgi:hypothetical protein